MSRDAERDYVSRSGQKLEAALREFAFRVDGLTCYDLGSHTGGFVDCLLRHGAACVHAVEPGVGVLALRIREDPRVVVHEGVNALTFLGAIAADLVTIDVGWTPQRLVLPAARRLLRADGAVISLIKPSYEAPKAWLRGGLLHEERWDETLELVRADARDAGWRIEREMTSPLPGHGGNREALWLLRPVK